MGEEVALAAAALAHYGLPAPSITFIRANENITYRVDADGESYLLRVHQAPAGSFAGAARAPEQIASELLWLEALARETDIPVQQPMRTTAGELVAAIQTETGPAPCSLLRWLAGESLSVDVPDAPELSGRLGALTARLHEHGAAWAPPPGFRRLVYDSAFVERTLATLSGGVAMGLFGGDDLALIADAGRAISAAMADLGRGADAWGLIHADLGPWNVLVHQGELRPIDFSLCGFGHFLFDLGPGVLCLPAPLREPFLQGYAALRPLPPQHARYLDAFALLGILSAFALHLPNPERHPWIRRRVPVVAGVYCRALLEGGRFLHLV